jgi:hypothetical protein
MSANSVCGKDVIGYTQGGEFISALVRAGLNKKLVQEVIESRGNHKAQTMMASLRGKEVVDKRFVFKTSFDIVVPEDYDHDTRLGVFIHKHGHEFNRYEMNINDRAYVNKALIRLTPGQRIKCKVFWINGEVCFHDCFRFLMDQNATLLNAQGITLAYEQGKDNLPIGRHYVSFDVEDSLLKHSVTHNLTLPCLDVCSDYKYAFDLRVISALEDRAGLLCFCNE